LAALIYCGLLIDNSYYSQDIHGPYDLYDIGNLELEEGDTIRACKLAYATFGKLNAAKDNAILVPTWYSGTNKIMEQAYIGESHALDPGKYFIVVVNQIGNGLSTSPHNTPPPAGMGNFPRARIGDDLGTEKRKMAIDGLDRPKLGIGNQPPLGLQSDGGKNMSEDIGMTKVLALMRLVSRPPCGGSHRRDPGFNNGFYTSSADVREGMLRHAKMWAVMGWSTEFFQQNRHKALGYCLRLDRQNDAVANALPNRRWRSTSFSCSFSSRTAMLALATAHDHLTRARCAVGYSVEQVAPRTTRREARWHAPLPAAPQMLAARAPARVLRWLLSLFAPFRSSRARTRSGCEKLSVNLS
jgi:hypothetical protein